MDGLAAPVRAGDTIAEKYVVDRVLGQGGMGVVVAASHATLNQRVALKFLLPDACDHPGAVERFLREARAAVQIQSEHVARVIDVGTLDTGSPYMVMEFLEGHDLARELELRGSLPPEEIAEYLLQACEAIAEAHSLKIVHRDLKPANLFLSHRKDGSRIVKVLDFGISKAVREGEAHLTQTATMMGSPLYMAPEQIRNAKAVDARADVWSLGVILHEALSGRVPFGGETLSGVLASIIADAPEPLSSLRPDLPEGLTALVARCLEKDPARRIQDVAELAELLAPFAPEQAQRTVPRARSILGRTAPAGTPSGAALEGTIAAAQTNESLTARPWSRSDKNDTHTSKRATLPLLVALGGLLLLGAGAIAYFGGTGPDGVEASSEGTQPPGAVGAEPITAAAAPAAPPPPSVEPTPAGPPAKPDKRDAEETPEPATPPSPDATPAQSAPAAPPSRPSTTSRSTRSSAPATQAARPSAPPTPSKQPAPPPTTNPLDGRR
ncbi:MAG: protein kinase [Myxococcales bacterium]|nr:protein kinase [Myxococcales bacterium]